MKLILEKLTAIEIRSWAWGVLVGLLAVVLAGRAFETHGRNVELHRRMIQEDSDLERLANEQARLRQELRALDEDPVYVESVLRWLRSDSSRNGKPDEKAARRAGRDAVPR